MKLSLFSICSLLTMALASLQAAEKSSHGPVYEMRVYYSPEGKLNDLHARFRDHTMKLFEKHGMKNVGYFVPDGANPENKLVYFLSYPSREAREKSWAAFHADPEWQRAARESERNGKLVRKVDQTFLVPTDYSPEFKIESKGGRVFELRTYTTPEGKLDALNARFRDHTVRLFTKHGIENVVYFTKAPGQEGERTTLVYLLAHKDRDSARQAFSAFGQDPEWKKAFAESQKDGSLTVPRGVKSEFLVPVDYSPLK